MNETDWLGQYVQNGSNEAFGRLVAQYVDLVYSTARRELRDSSLADDATQAVFLILSQKAGSVPQKALLSSWLFKTTRNVCRNARRLAARRYAHERKAAEMRSEIQNPAPSPAWEQLSPLLNEAVGSLGSKERDAILLRYFEKKETRDIAAALGISEHAARKRLSRGIEHLSRYFLRQGVTTSALAIDAGLLTYAVQLAPPGVHHAAAAALSSQPCAHSVISLAKGALIMTTKTKVAIAAAALLLIGSTTAVIMNARSGSTSSAPAPVLPVVDASAPVVIRVKANIDGRSQIYIQGNTVKWLHHEYAAPGRLGGTNEPTFINGKQWFPTWPGPDDSSNQDHNTSSSTYDRLNPPLPKTPLNVQLNPITARGLVQVIQQPTIDNQYTLVVEFDDTKDAGASTYDVEIVCSPATAGTAISSPVWKATTPSGFTAEVVAVSAMADATATGERAGGLGKFLGFGSSKPKIQWWGPDGSALADPPSLSGDNVFLGTSNVYRFFVKVDVPENVGTTFRIEPTGGSWGSSGRSRGEQVIYASLPPARKNFTIRFGCATGAWTTIAKTSQLDTKTTVTITGTRKGQVTFSPLEATVGGVSMTITTRALPDGQDRFVAIAGTDEIEGRCFMSNGNGSTNTMTIEFPGVERESIQRIEIQNRPFNEWIGLKGISLQPRASAAATLPAASSAH